MSLDIINAPALQGAIEEALSTASPVLRDYHPGLRAYLRRAAESHESIRTAHRRKSDPSWAQTKFDEGRVLYRLYARDHDELVEDIRNQFDELVQVAVLARDGRARIQRNAAAFLKSLPHRRGTIRDLGREAWRFIEQAETAALRARRHEIIRPSAHISAGPLHGTRCVSIDEITQLGRMARNCLSDNEGYWKQFASGKIDIWSLHDGDRLVAALEVKRASNEVAEAFGPTNATIGLHDVREVTQFCMVAGFGIGRGCEGLLTEFATPYLVEPRVIEDGKRIAIYAEWPTAVRIDLSDSSGRMGMFRGSTETLALSFDPDRRCGESALEQGDPRHSIVRFGRKRVRRIVRAIALDQMAPTLVQHRLLTLAA